MKLAVLLLSSFLAITGAVRASVVPPGIYERDGHDVYVGVEHTLPDAPENQYFDPLTQRTGSIGSKDTLRARLVIHEERRVVTAKEGRLGASLYYSDRTQRPTIILIHGNDPETREMGFIIPFFVLSGVNVISYDQRGTGDSAGNWFLNGPAQRGGDVEAVYDAFQFDALVDSHGIGVWGFSNGGWTAPILAVRRPLAFMILKSAPAESLLSNIDYEAVQEMHGHGQSAQHTQEALAAWHSLEGAVTGTQSWETVKSAYANAKAQSWFAYSLLPDIPLPPQPAFAAGLRRFVSYDPVEVLRQVTTPTLALYGDRDRKVDVPDSSTRMRQYFHASRMRDFTMHVYPQAGHTLVVSHNGCDPVEPARYVPGYPQVMISWLAARGFTKPQASH